MTETSVITGASTGIGRELARLCAADGHRLILCANEPELEAAGEELRGRGVEVATVRADLSTEDGVSRLLTHLGNQRIDNLFANAGVALGGAFVDQDFDDIRRVIDLNVIGSTLLLHRVARRMRDQGAGRILITGSVGGLVPGSYNAVYNGTKAYLDSLSYAIRDELDGTGVTVTCLMPGPTDTELFRRSGMQDTPIGHDDGKDDPAMVARKGYDAMRKGESGVTTGFKNKLRAAASGLVPDTFLARAHRRGAKPGED